MLKPEYLLKVPASMVELYSQAEMDILTDMARRISTYDYWIPAAEHQAKMLEEMGMVREEIISHLKGLTGKSHKELTALMEEAAEVALKSDDAVYKRNGLNPGPVRASKPLQKVLQSGYKRTQKLFDNLTLTTAKTATKQFENALNRAYMQIALGGMDYNSAVRSAVKELSKQGVGAVQYSSGKIDNLETAVRRATITGINQTALKMQEARADEMGCDLVETSAHAGARPSHAKWQGEIFSRSDKSKKYPDFVQSTGYGKGEGLGGWNCSHSFSPYFEGSSRTYTKEQLTEYQDKNYTYNGRKMTEYEVLGEQRNIERNIRRWKREQSALRA
ncbi:MAG TPA: phage capsid protein, partial [Clostridium sp.]|nr:phage capsid protein [Clostridium sp.]